jgi:chemotaxis protein MotB
MKQFRTLVARFQKMINDGKLEVLVRGGRMLVKLRDDILFDPGKVDVKSGGQDALREVALILKDVPDRDFQVAGHTDNVPIKGRRYRSNWQLSTERALQVARILREAGMPANHLSAAGFADTVPVAENVTEEGRRKNRRIEIVLEPNISELPNLDHLLKAG